MHLPENINDTLKFVIALALVVGAILIEHNTQAVPTWLTIAVSAVIAYYFGLTSNSRKID